MNSHAMGSRGRDRRCGAAITVVMGLTLLGTMAAASVAFSAGSRIRQARRQINLEKAFYLAEAGAERAASRIAGGNLSAGTLTGTLGDGSYTAVISVVSQGGASQINVASTGTVDGVDRSIFLRGLRRVSWARFALWYDQEATDLWIARGEQFNGPVYARPTMRFHSYLQPGFSGEAHFYDRAWTAANSIVRQNSSVNPIFDVPLRTGVQVDSMATVNFEDLYDTANLVLDGTTSIRIAGETMYVTNSRRGWNNTAMPVPQEGTVYVRRASGGSTSTRTANLTVEAPTGLDGRVTLVAENDILVANHVRYQDNPATNPSSNDALGLIAARHVAVQTTAPNNLDIYAHIICRDGGFGVTDYNKGRVRGSLNVYGGIVNQIRNPVGTTSGTGYVKNYIFDQRFESSPPPNYPRLADTLQWSEWNG